ncbi:C6 transcription factor [Histoplasma capsulatum var. duboisii H88]|uniref:C6 transcription factor n=1 Tax=Ajellomyces capsulatus (strain H88) TaxID=544711 RepID=F0UD97_AJEC8|nr:C6 transcription factor [Histoplasma capsulatum var. duboisii H88]
MLDHMDHETRHAGNKRKRVSKACDRCRGKKYRCDGLRPACLACRECGHDCSYDPSPKKRGLPEGYVRGLEKLWALSMSNIEGLEGAVLEMLGSKEGESPRRKKLVALWNNEGASEKLHGTWKSSELYANVEELLSSPGSTTFGSSCSEEDGGGIELGDSVSNIVSDPHLVDFSDSRIGEFSPWALTRSRYTSPLSPGTDEKRIHLSYMNQAAKSDARMELPTQTSHLLNMYFAYTHSWFPILAKHEVLKASYQYSSPSFQMERNLTGSGNHAVLWAIISYTATQIPSGADANSMGLTKNPHKEAKEFYAVARNLIPDEKGKFEIGHVQAALLLTLVNIGFGDWTAAWVLCGQAASIAIDLGLGARSKETQRPSHAKHEETFLGCFLLDTLLSARLARCPRLRSDSIQGADLLEEDGLEEWSPWVDVFLLCKLHGGNPCPRRPLRSCSTFNRLIELSKLLNMLYNSAPMTHEYFFTSLQHWEEKLPQGCRLSDQLDTSWFESVASQISLAGGVWPVYSSLVADMKQLTSDEHFLHSLLLDPGSSGRSSASLYPQFSLPSNENVYRILDSLAPPSQDDTDSVQAVNEEDVSFPLVPKTPVEPFSGSDYRNSSEPFLLSSPQASDDIWIDLGSPTVTMQQIQTTTPRFPRARARAKICLSPSTYMSHAFKANPKRTNHHPEPVNDGHTHGQQKSTPTLFPNHKPAFPLSGPASNDIDSIFHDLPSPSNSETSTSDKKAFITFTHSGRSPHQHLIVDTDDEKACEDALLLNNNDDSSMEGYAKELRDPKEENESWEGTGKLPLRNSIMRPPSIADIWPPPGFFPDTFGVEEGTGN